MDSVTTTVSPGVGSAVASRLVTVTPFGEFDPEEVGHEVPETGDGYEALPVLEFAGAAVLGTVVWTLVGLGEVVFGNVVGDAGTVVSGTDSTGGAVIERIDSAAARV